MVVISDKMSEFKKLEAGGKPSTWFPPGGLVELIIKPKEAFQIHLEAVLARIYFRFTKNDHLNKEKTKFTNMMTHRAQNEPTKYQQWIKDNLCPQFQSTQMAANDRTEPISAIFL